MGKAKLLAFAALLGMVFNFATPTSEPAEAVISPPCTFTNSVEEPILDSDCSLYPGASGSASFDSCEYRSYGIEIASSTDGISRVAIATANGLGFQDSPNININVDVQENCNHGYGDPYYLIEIFAVSDDGQRTQLTKNSVSAIWNTSRANLLPGYCGFWSCGRSFHEFSGTLPSEGKYSIYVYAALAETGLSDGIDNKVVVFPSVLEYRTSTTAPTAISWGVSWAETSKGFKCELDIENQGNLEFSQGFRQANLKTTDGPTSSIQKTYTSYTIEFKDPGTFSGSSNSKLEPAKSPFSYGEHNFSNDGNIVIGTELHQMSQGLIYTCKAWLTTLRGPTEVRSAFLTAPRTFAPAVPKLWYKNKWLSRFSSESYGLSEAQRQLIRDQVEAHPDATKFICTGIVTTGVSDSRNLFIRKRAKAACEYAKTLNPNLSTWYQRKFSKAAEFEGRVLFTIKGEE